MSALRLATMVLEFTARGAPVCAGKLRAGVPDFASRLRAAPVPLLTRVVTVLAVFEMPFKIAVAVVVPEGAATAWDTTPPTRATTTTRLTARDVAPVRRQSLLSAPFVTFIRHPSPSRFFDEAFLPSGR
jgi:hypothetical protein